MSLSKPLQILFAGAALAALVAGGVVVLNAVDRGSSPTVAEAQARIQALMAECKAESAKKQAAAKARAAAGEKVPPWEFDPFVCAPTLLKGVTTEGLQKDLVEAQEALEAARIHAVSSELALWPYAAAVAIVVFSAVPWLWYFLLRRLVELREAILGR